MVAAAVGDVPLAGTDAQAPSPCHCLPSVQQGHQRHPYPANIQAVRKDECGHSLQQHAVRRQPVTHHAWHPDPTHASDTRWTSCRIPIAGSLARAPASIPRTARIFGARNVESLVSWVELMALMVAAILVSSRWGCYGREQRSTSRTCSSAMARSALVPELNSMNATACPPRSVRRRLLMYPCIKRLSQLARQLVGAQLGTTACRTGISTQTFSNAPT